MTPPNQNKTNNINFLEGKWTRTWLLGKWEFESSKSWKIPSYKMGTALHLVGQMLIPQSLWQGGRIEDVAGISSGSGEGSPVCLEVKGKIKTSTKEWEGFDFKIETPFSSFREPHHIVHSAKENRSPNIPLFLKPENLGRAIPLKIDEFKISLSFYESKHTIFLGYNPVVTAEVIITAKDGDISAHLSVDQLPSSKSDLLAEKSAAKLFSRLDLSPLQY
jgi:hypothetical protein